MIVNETILDLVVERRTDVADGIITLTFAAPDGSALPAWEPGAHVDLVLPNGLTRQYSICSEPSDRHRISVAVLDEPESRGGSRYIHEQVHEGARIGIGSPRNHFRLDPVERYTFVAGGVGITPIMPMVSAAERAGADWVLYYGGRTRTSMAFLDELVVRYGDRIIAQPQDEVGLLDLEAVRARGADGGLIYCCGPEPLLAALETSCASIAEAVRLERFHAKEQDFGPDTAFEVEVADNGLVVQVEPGVSIMETLRAAGLDVPSSCEEGTCGTCECGVLSGTVDHRDSLLTPAEQAANDCMMICVSRATSSRLVIEL
ncbi:2Fe-2S iron-sulfur cluster binding domain-containing protein [Epidermidibacterium keratini]|uniref:2Fe-2S iron-sulfur cluster binding domain-containing protein n=2 Tax=Epidermidibacterium keratini TaxID=1891644 RepID=A0A7L4YW14_9ACTN|nr:2Fe-2S iron-sulfur cluster binding domain-containing protein [Epidermidibacterium keratini]